MRFKSYKAGLKQRLGDSEYAAEYLAQVLTAKDSAALLLGDTLVFSTGRTLSGTALQTNDDDVLAACRT
jgi:hypothetical protein